MICFSPRKVSRVFLAAGFLSICASSVLQGEWASPERFFDQEKIERTSVAPGVEWIAAKGKRAGEPIVSHILAIDLKGSGITVQNLLGNRQFKEETRQRMPRSTVSQLAADSGALAAINTAFFDIRGTQTPTGFLYTRGRLIREPQRGQLSLLVLKDGTVTARTPEWSGEVEVNGASHKLAAINSPSCREGQFVLYRSPWRLTMGKDGLPKNQEKLFLSEIVLEKPPSSQEGSLSGKVKEVRINKSGIPLGTGEFALAYGGELPFQVSPGDEVRVRWTLDFTGEGPPVTLADVSEGFTGGAFLVSKGERITSDAGAAKLKHPRSAVGFDEKGERLLLVAVEGRSSESAGFGMNALGEFLQHLGSVTAVNLDGGGSTALGALVGGDWRVLNRTSDGSERNVPAGLGLFVPEGKRDVQ